MGALHDFAYISQLGGSANGQEVAVENEGGLDLQGFLGLSERVRNGYENIKVNFKVKTDALEETLKKFMKRSPVFDIVTNPVPVSLSVETT